MSRFVMFLSVWMAVVLAACAHGAATGGPSAADQQSGDSGKSSEEGNSSDESGNSSDDSGNSSDNSNQSSDESGQSSDDEATEQESEESSEESSKDSTDDTSSRGEDQMSNAPVLTSAGVLITGTAVGVVLWMQSAAADPAQAQATAEITRRWLAANAHQLAVDLALGAGPALADLAGAAGIAPEHQLAFGRLLRAHRSELLALCNPRTLTAERALAFLERVGELSREDPVLVEDYRRFTRAHHAAR